MIINHIVKPEYEHIAVQLSLKALGVELFDQQDVLNPSWCMEIVAGDWYLQYRRPGYDRINASSGNFEPSDYRHVPPVIEKNYTSRAVGYRTAKHPNTKAALRIFKVDQLVSGDTRGRIKVRASSYYSRPSDWSCARSPGMGKRVGAWKDERNIWSWSRKPWVTGPNVSDKGRTSLEFWEERHDGGLGVIGKLDPEIIGDFFNADGSLVSAKKDRFFALVRVLLGENIRGSDTYDLLSEVADEFNRSLPPR